MANEEVLGSRKTAIVLVIVVGCFAMLWPRILSPLVLGQARDDLKPNQFDRDSGCCEVIFETEVAVLELLNEVCSSLIGADGKLSPLKASECRKAVNATCGLDIAAFLKRSENVGKTTKAILEVMKTSNSSCLREHFGVPIWSLGVHVPINFKMVQDDKLKQERPLIRGAGPHPAFRERGRAIPAGDPIPPSRATVSLPPHIRVRSPLSEYFTPQPPPIPGMRPPLGSAGGPVPAPKSAVNVMMPIYTICIIVFFVYTLSKLLFKRGNASPYESVNPDPQFRRQVFRDDSRTTPDTKLGHKETDVIVSAISGLVAEVRQQMDASYNDNMQQTQDVQDEQARPHTNGTIKSDLNSSHSDQIRSKQDLNQKPLEPVQELVENDKVATPVEESINKKEASPVEQSPNLVENSNFVENVTPSVKDDDGYLEEPVEKTNIPDLNNVKNEDVQINKEDNSDVIETNEVLANGKVVTEKTNEFNDGIEWISNNDKDDEKALDEAFDKLVDLDDDDKSISGDWLTGLEEEKPNLNILSSALNDSSLDASAEEEDDKNDEIELKDEKSTVKVLGMETTAHTADGGAWPRAECVPRPAPPPHPSRAPPAEDVASIFLETDIPQQTRVLVSEFEDHADRTTSSHSPLVVSGKMTLSLIQDSPRVTPERDPESTVDDYTTASVVTLPADGNVENIAGEDEEVQGSEEEEILGELLGEVENDEEDEPIAKDFGKDKVLEDAGAELGNHEDRLVDHDDVLDEINEVLDKEDGGEDLGGQELRSEDLGGDLGDQEEVEDEEIEIEYIEEEEEEN